MVDRHGISVPLHSPPDAKADIVFVHGLGGDRINTWTASKTSEVPNDVFWPKDLLPHTAVSKECNQARILSFGYNADFAHFYPFYGQKRIASQLTIDDHSTALLEGLAGLRAETDSLQRPLIFIAHSLGGLVVANALSRQHGASEKYKQVVASTCGCMFLGTPFEGSSKARWGNIALNVVSWISTVNSESTKDLEERSQKLVSINDAFAKFLKQRDQSNTAIGLACFCEQYPTYKLGKNIGYIVPRDSASLSGVDVLSIAGNHVDMCKFIDEHRDGYATIARTLSQWVVATEDKEYAESGHAKATVYMGSTIYKEKISGNSGVVAGNIYTPARDGIRITGTNNNYGAGWKDKDSEASD